MVEYTFAWCKLTFRWVLSQFWAIGKVVEQLEKCCIWRSGKWCNEERCNEERRNEERCNEERCNEQRRNEERRNEERCNEQRCNEASFFKANLKMKRECVRPHPCHCFDPEGEKGRRPNSGTTFGHKGRRAQGRGFTISNTSGSWNRGDQFRFSVIFKFTEPYMVAPIAPLKAKSSNLNHGSGWPLGKGCRFTEILFHFSERLVFTSHPSILSGGRWWMDGSDCTFSKSTAMRCW